MTSRHSESWIKRLGECFKYLVGAALCFVLTSMCLKPLFGHRATVAGSRTGAFDWILGAPIFFVIGATALISIVVAIMCLVLAFRSLRKSDGQE